MREISEKLKVPVGLIAANFGGTKVESWMKADVLKKHQNFQKIIDELEKYKNLIVNPGAINGQDIVWLNGNVVGKTLIFGLARHQRNYEINGCQFLTGTNSIVIWNYCSKYDGGFRGPAKSMGISPSGEKEKAVSLAGEWKYKKGFEGVKLPKTPLSMQLCYKSPVVLYNSMIAPLIPYAIKGVLWYQGESNVRTAKNYRELFTDMIKSWRSEWNQGDFPFYFVQIAPFKYSDRGNLSAELLREAQFLSLNLTNTGMVVTLDIGNPGNIHPKNEITVGHRLALWALAKNYGFTNIVFSGPLYKNYEISGNKIILSFNYAAGLKTSDGKSPSNFEIAGANKKFFRQPQKSRAIKLPFQAKK